MSEILTRIRLPGKRHGGFMDRGRHTAAAMIATMRRHAEYQKAEAEAVLSASDTDFRVDVVRGSCVQRVIEVLQTPRLHTEEKP